MAFFAFSRALMTSSLVNPSKGHPAGFEGPCIYLEVDLGRDHQHDERRPVVRAISIQQRRTPVAQSWPRSERNRTYRVPRASQEVGRPRPKGIERHTFRPVLTGSPNDRNHKKHDMIIGPGPCAASAASGCLWVHIVRMI